MAIQTVASSEQTPLLDPDRSERSSQTLAESEQALIDHDAARQSVGATRATLLILSLWALIFLQASNMSGLTTTQSTIAEDLDAFAEANWFTSAYLIALSSLAPLAGRLSQIFSPRHCILFSSVFFAIGGLVTSQAQSFQVFIAGRVISGIGGAGIMTLSIILVLELTSKKKRGLFIGMVNAGYTSGVALGAVIAGALLPITGWRAMFLVQSPLGILAGLGVFFSIPKSFVSGPKGADERPLLQKLASIDYVGAVTLSGSIVLFLYGLSSVHVQWIPIAISPILLICFVLNEIYLSKDPIVPVSVLSSRGVLLTCLAQLGFMSARWTVLFYSPVYAIAVRNWSLASAGSILVPTNLGFGLGGLIIGWLHIRRGGSFLLSCILSFICFAATLFFVGLSSTAALPPWIYIGLVFCNGLSTGAALNYTLAHMLHVSAPSNHFIVSSLLATFRGFAGSFGSAIGGGIFQRLLSSSLTQGYQELDGNERTELVRKLLGSPALVGTLTGGEREVAVRGYEGALKGLFLSATLCAFIMVLLQAAAGRKKGEDGSAGFEDLEEEVVEEESGEFAA